MVKYTKLVYFSKYKTRKTVGQMICSSNYKNKESTNYRYYVWSGSPSESFYTKYFQCERLKGGKSHNLFEITRPCSNKHEVLFRVTENDFL